MNGRDMLLTALTGFALATGGVLACGTMAPAVARTSGEPEGTALAAAPAAPAGFPDDSTIQRLIVEHRVRERVPGIVVGLLENGRTRVFATGESGRADLPLDDQTIFEIGSMTKVFTATLLAEMAQRRMVRLDDLVRLYLPSGTRVPDRDGREITLQDLATHVSGLPRLPTNLFSADARAPIDFRNPYATYGPERLHAFLNEHTLRRAPGERYEYSNIAFALLGDVLTRAAGVDYETLLTQFVLRPLGLQSTAVILPPELQARLAVGHLPNGDPASNWDFALAAPGGLRSSAADLLRFLAANVDPANTALAEAIRATQQPHSAPGLPGDEIGLGWHFARLPGRRALAHDGRTGGYWSFVAADSDRARALVILVNQSHPLDALAARLLRWEAP